MNMKTMILVFLMAVLILISACKLSLKHEIWLENASSGEVMISAEAEYPKEAGNEDDPSMTEENPLIDYVNFAAEFLQIKILDQKIEDLSDAENNHYLYSVKAEFGDLEELGYWLGVTDEAGIEAESDEEGTVLRVYPARNELLSMGRLEGELEDLTIMDIASEYTIHTPAPMLYATDADWVSEDNLTATWEDVIDYDFYTEPEPVYELKF